MADGMPKQSTDLTGHSHGANAWSASGVAIAT
jgi:hypothetical protein